jgi:putative FmdB family regulatory protein
MPTYEYLCNKCEHAFEAVQSFTEPAIQNCPQCKGEVRKVYNNVGVVFKGSGFYKTDSRTTPTTKSDTPTAKTESTSTPKSETATSTKTESKTPPKSSE